MSTRSIIVIAFLAGLLLIGGQFGLKNNPSPASENREVKNKDISDQKRNNAGTPKVFLNIPVNVYVVDDLALNFSTNRGEEDVNRILKEVNKIWSQASIGFEINKSARTEIKSIDHVTIENLDERLIRTKSYNRERINIYFVKTLYGSNGMAIADKNIILIADYTTVNDFRAVSHELGHILGLAHTAEDQNRLMYQGANGTLLVESEMEPARRHAKTDFAKDETAAIKNVSLDVPFVAQAPLGDWKEERQQNACEEASALMAMRWVDGKELTPKEAVKEIIAISDYELKTYGHFHDTSAKDTVERIFNGYFKYENVELKYNIGVDDIKRELSKGNLVIVPVNGQKLNNPFYAPPGPLEHNIVVIGYDAETKEFITNDPGTRRGEKFRYPDHVLEKALQDYPTGFHEPITEINKVMIVVKPSS